MTDIAALVTEHQSIRAQIDLAEKQMSEYLKPHRHRLEQLQAEITTAMTTQGLKSLKTDSGTAILSEINAARIKPEERDAYIDFCLDNWSDIGGEMMQIGAPKADAVRNYMDSHEGQLPPHIEMTTTLRFSIRKA